MKPATRARLRDSSTKILIFNQNKSIEHSSVGELDHYFSKGDVLVVNSAATIPARYQVQTNGLNFEVRLAGFCGPNFHDLKVWWAIALGSGDWRTPTEERDDPPYLNKGELIHFGNNLTAKIISVQNKRLLKLEFLSQNSQKIVKYLYKYGDPIQYSYLKDDLKIWDQQTLFSTIPLSVEPPSASLAFSWDLIARLKSRGVNIVPLYHSAGLSSSGDLKTDKLLPLPEWYCIPEKTAETINGAFKGNQRVIALGTSALRAMEASLVKDQIVSGSGIAKNKINSQNPPRSIDGLITGIHEIHTSHFSITRSLVSEGFLKKAYCEAEERSYLGHEYGDICIVFV